MKTFECTKNSLCRINSFQRELFSKPSKDSLLSFSRKNQILFVIFLIWLTFGLNLAIFSFVFSSDFDHTLFQSLNLSFWRAASWELSVYNRQVTEKELINDEPVISKLVCNRILFEAPSLATSIPHFEPIQKLSFLKNIIFRIVKFWEFFFSKEFLLYSKSGISSRNFSIFGMSNFICFLLTFPVL